jgi:hypothetical protein
MADDELFFVSKYDLLHPTATPDVVKVDNFCNLLQESCNMTAGILSALPSSRFWPFLNAAQSFGPEPHAVKMNPIAIDCKYLQHHLRFL